MRRNPKRLEVLERAADKEIFANSLPFAVAYYLGGAKHTSEVVYAYARALGYLDLDELCRGFADLLRGPSDLDDRPRGIQTRMRRAQWELLAKFGYDLRRTSPAALADAPYRIIRTLPEEWRAALKSAHRERCEAEARTNRLLKDLERAEEFGIFAVSDSIEGDPR